MKIIAIDCGTSFLKAALLEAESGQILEQRTVSMALQQENVKFPKIHGVIKAVEELLKVFRKYGTEFWVGISTEMHGFILTDDQDQILCDYVSWKDEWALQRKKEESYLDEIASLVGTEMFRTTGMSLKPGIASTNLYVLLDREPQMRKKKIRFFTLGDYLIYYLTGCIPVMHPTNAAASGLYDLEQHCWHKQLIGELGYDFIQFPEVGEDNCVDVMREGHHYWFCEAIGDQQAALLGSGLARSDEVSLNLGTGSQVSVLSDKLTFHKAYQTRPFFHGKYLNTIPHVPCGRALNVYVRFFTDILERYTGEKIDEKRLWTTLLESVEKSSDTELEIDMSFFANSVTGQVRGGIHGISEDNLCMGSLMRAVFEQMAQNYYDVTKKLLNNTKQVHTVIFSGGVASKNSFLREKIMSRFEGCEMKLASDETFYGLWKYVKEVYDGRLR